MKTLGIVEAEVVRQAGIEIKPGDVVHQVDAFILHAPPEAFNKDVVQGTASAVHADPSASRQHGVGERLGCELGALIGVEDVRPALLEGLAQSNQAELTIQSVGELPSQHVSTVPINHGHQIHETTSHRNVGNVGAPDLIRTGYRQPAQEIREYLVPWSRFACSGLGIDGLQAHYLHQTLDPLVVDRMFLTA